MTDPLAGSKPVSDTSEFAHPYEAKRSALGRDPDPAAKIALRLRRRPFAAEPRRRPGRMSGELAISA